ncbi:MAG TPA: bifunctional DNA-formamidopyrimidine glycosylase/DNA-(apurinic or apyrimidinic site) lyase [Pirellulales bacterium]|jgi:formamidopyrimidine-DNA glycosylase|nr:bifunctional DNA-formamidopyrimidine glycosylase/DNA-(apurinic or apyrimidinic site) lyase [Pirellulales bacterium]
MPELPEVETMRRGILPIVGSRIRQVDRVPCRRKPIVIAPRLDRFRRRVVGQQVIAVERAGKRVVLRLESTDRIVLEPRMTGLVLLADPPSREHLRFRIELAGGPIAELFYWDRRGLGRIRLLSAAEFSADCGRSKLGPDALEISVDELRDNLRASSRAIKVALLDQKQVAGIGNLYASEMLFAARIHPARRCRQLTRIEWERLHAEMRRILETAIRYEGSTLSDGTYRNALNESGGYQNEHRVYDQARNLCSACGSTEIVRIVQAQRATFFCPTCQPKTKRRQ